MRSLEAGYTFDSADDEGEQDIQEVWFPGCHADIGGGWPLGNDDVALSHVALVWMVREAQKAGLEFDELKLEALMCCYEEATTSASKSHNDIPTIDIAFASPTPTYNPMTTNAPPSVATAYTDDSKQTSYQTLIH
jgi:hypothetical protein